MFVLSICAYGGVFLAFCVRVFSCIVMMPGCVLCTKVFLFLVFVSDAVYIDLKYDDVFVLWLIVVCEWVGGDLFLMGCLCLVLLLRIV